MSRGLLMLSALITPFYQQYCKSFVKKISDLRRPCSQTGVEWERAANAWQSHRWLCLQFETLSISSRYCVLDSEKIKTSISDFHCRLHKQIQQRLALCTEEKYRFELMENNNYRHHAYRCYVYYICVHVNVLLGCAVRKVIPSCAVLEIRRRWPDPNRGLI